MNITRGYVPRPVVVQTPFRGVGDRSVAAQRDVVFPDMVVVEGPPRDTVVYLLAAAFGIVHREAEVFQIVP